MKELLGPKWSHAPLVKTQTTCYSSHHSVGNANSHPGEFSVVSSQIPWKTILK